MRFVMTTLSLTGLLIFSTAAHAKDAHGSWKWKGAKADSDVKSVEGALKNIDGVAQVTATKATIRLTYDAAKVTEERIASAVSAAGPYTLVKKAAKGSAAPKQKADGKMK